MKRSKETSNDRPVVIVRKKARTKSSLSSAARPRPKPHSPMTKAATPATSATPATAKTGPNKKERERQAQRELLEVLRDRWPQAFPAIIASSGPWRLASGKISRLPCPSTRLGGSGRPFGCSSTRCCLPICASCYRGAPATTLRAIPAGR